MKITATCPIPRLPIPDQTTARAHADLARRLYPGPVGELVAHEILTAVEFGYHFGAQSQLRRLIRALDEEAARRRAAETERVAEAARSAFRGSWAGTASEVHR